MKVAPYVPSGDDCRAAQQARRAGSALDLDLAAMPVLPRGASHANRVQWIQLMAEQQLSPVDVADSDQH